MPTLDAVIRSLLSYRKGHALRLGHGLALRYTPPDKEHGSQADTLSLSRRGVPPSASEVQTVVRALAVVLNEPGKEFLVTEAGNIRRIWFVRAVCPEHEEPLPCSACATLLIMAK
jgi:hypothetical protein